MNTESTDIIETIGVGGSLIVLAVGLADITDVINILPTAVYLITIWLLAIGFWAYQKQKTA